MRSEGYGSRVCVSVKSHFTSGASACPENNITYSAGNEGQKICGDFSETAPLQRYTARYRVATAVTFRSKLYVEYHSM